MSIRYSLFCEYLKYLYFLKKLLFLQFNINFIEQKSKHRLLPPIIKIPYMTTLRICKLTGNGDATGTLGTLGTLYIFPLTVYLHVTQQHKANGILLTKNDKI